MKNVRQRRKIIGFIRGRVIWHPCISPVKNFLHQMLCGLAAVGQLAGWKKTEAGDGRRGGGQYYEFNEGLVLGLELTV